MPKFKSHAPATTAASKRFVKPWRSYLKQLEAAHSSVLEALGPQPFEEAQTANWISELKFLEVWACEHVVRNLVESLSEGQPWKFSTVIDDKSLPWQMILRIECGLAYCEGRYWKRKAFDWEQPRPIVLRWLLHDLWYIDGLYWASRRFGALTASTRSGQAIVSTVLLPSPSASILGKN